jgi:hypothetical protein
MNNGKWYWNGLAQNDCFQKEKTMLDNKEGSKIKRSVCLVILILLLASSCNAPFTAKPASPTQPPPHTRVPLTDTLPAAGATVPPTETVTPIPPTLTAVPPTLTAGPKAKAKVPSKTPRTTTLKIFLIGMNDNGVSGKLVGCGDSAVPVTMVVPYTTGVLRASLDKLLAIKDQNYGQSGLYNALYQSTLKVSSLALKDGVATVHLTGKLTLGGECDDPRVQAELEETALQFSTVKKVSFYVNNVALSKLLSGK